MSDTNFDNLLTHTCTIKHRYTTGSTTDKWGALTENINTSEVNVQCRIQQRGGDLEFTKRGEKLVSKHIGFFKFDVSIVEDDIIVFNGKSYSVMSVSDAAGEGHHLECDLLIMEN